MVIIYIHEEERWEEQSIHVLDVTKKKWKA
jgi:hypothetical protein